jgi:hypothetical protein
MGIGSQFGLQMQPYAMGDVDYSALGIGAPEETPEEKLLRLMGGGKVLKKSLPPSITNPHSITNAVSPGQALGPTNAAAAQLPGARQLSQTDPMPGPDATPVSPPAAPARPLQRTMAAQAGPTAPQPQQAPSVAVSGPAAPSTPDYLNPAYPGQQQAAADALREQALSQLQPSEEAMRSGKLGALAGTIAGLGMQAMGGEALAPAGGMMLKQAMAQQEKYTADPFRDAQLKAKKYELQAQALENRAKSAVTAQERQQALQQARELRQMADETKRMGYAMMGQNAAIAQGARADAQKGVADQRTFQRAAALRNDFDPLVKDQRTSIATFPQIEAALTRKVPTAQSDMRAIFRFMKMLDPTSVVRESEYANAQNAAGVPDRIRVLFNKAKDGQLLAPNQRKAMLDEARSEAAVAQQYFNTTAKRFHEMAVRAGVDPQDVTPGYDFGTNQQKPTAEEGIDVGAALKTGAVPGRRKDDYRTVTY